MNVYNMNQSHGIHRMHTQINPLHHFVQGVVRRLSPADHNRALTNGTVGDLTLEAVNNERDALVQQVVQVRGDPRHLRHHPNLQPDNKFFSVHVQPQQKTHLFTYRKTVIHHTMAMVAAIYSGRVQAHDDLVPPLSIAQVLWKAR